MNRRGISVLGPVAALYVEPMTTPLHAALGQPGTELTIGLVKDACTSSVAETDQLDWKRDLPLPSGAATHEQTRAMTLELAKDLAAMANSRGGMLVYGVSDEGGRADELVGVPDPSDGVMERQIRQVAYNFVHPPLQIRCISLSDDEQHVFIIEIPESDEAPHLVQPKRDGGNVGWFVAPYRSGSDTNNMVEKQLEGAYRQRIDGRRRQHRQLRELHEELSSRHIGDNDQATGTVVALAQPMRLRTRPWPDGDPSRLARTIVSSAAVLASQLAGELGRVDQWPITLLNEATIPRRALRRFVFTAERQMRGHGGAPLGRPVYVALELHDNGTVGFIWRRGAGYSFARQSDTLPPTPALGTTDMDIVALLLLSLALTTDEELELATDYQLRVALAPHKPIHLLPDQGWAGGDYPLVAPSPALEADVRLESGPDARAADFLALGQDLNNMVEQRYTALEGFWELPRGTRPEHSRRVLAQRLFGGEPDHPITGSTMA